MTVKNCHFCGKELNIRVEGHWCCNGKECRSKSIKYLIDKYEPLLDRMAHDD